MLEPREPRSIIEAAEQSAAAGDYASAETLLREAAGLQEASLGPLHPDLANTLNNLGVVCEMNDNAVDAEDCFRRAVAIATTVLTPDHPFVATSRQNLRDFCEARGKEVEPSHTESQDVQMATESVEPLRESSSHTESQDVQVATESVDPVHQSPSDPESQDVQLPVRRKSIRPIAIGGLGPAVMLIMILTAVRLWPNSTEQGQSASAIATESPSAIATDSPREIPTGPQAPLPVEPISLPKETTKTSEGGANGESARRLTEASTPVQLTVVKARLCADLDDFLCDPPDNPVPPGPLFFYTEVTSSSATTIQHRWYRDNRLFQSVPLRVQANPRGYRTFSRNTMTGESAGNWRVELRTEDGVVLHEERFSVR